MARLTRDTAAAYLRDPASVDPTVAGVLLELAATRGDRALWDTFRPRFEAAKEPAERDRLLSALGDFRAPEVAAEALRHALTGPLRPNELLEIPFAMFDTPERRERVFDWSTQHYGAIAGRIPVLIVSQLPHLAGGCEEARLAAAQRFFAQPEHRTEGTAQTLARVEQQVRRCGGARARPWPASWRPGPGPERGAARLSRPARRCCGRW